MTETDDLLARDSAAFFHQHGSTPSLGALRAAQGIWLEDADGRRFIDLHGNTVHHLGHGNPEIVAALKAQLNELAFAPRRYTNPPAVALAEALSARWPGPPARVLFATGGSDAIEIALKLARVATGRSETVSLEGAYHGHGFGAFGLSSAAPDPRLGAFLPGRHHVTPYWVGEDGPARMLQEIARHLATGRIAAVIAEPMRANCHVPPADLWPQVRALCDAHGAKLIFDEIPSGLGKTGRFFAFEHFGAVPDLAVLGKALGGGMVPLAAVIGDARLDVAPELELGHYTHEKNPLTTRAALTALEITARDALVARAQAAGQRLCEGIAAIATRVALRHRDTRARAAAGSRVRSRPCRPSPGPGLRRAPRGLRLRRGAVDHRQGRCRHRPVAAAHRHRCGDRRGAGADRGDGREALTQRGA
jgi:4-aminobutyrate aminotransferase